MTSSLYSTYSIAGQVAMVTGASAGIGEAIAWRLAEAGCKLVLIARREDRLAALSRALQERYPDISVHVEVMDVRDLERVSRLADELPAEFREVDILVANAGLALGVAAVHENDLEDLKVMLDTNVTSVVAFSRAFTPGMIQRNRGHLVFMSSIAGQESYDGGSMYCATKHALHAFVKAIRMDLVATNIRVTSISPGAVKTEFSVVRFKGDEQRAGAVYEGFDPLTAADIADNTLYALTRPPHVQIADVTVFATNQSSAKGLARVKQQSAGSA